MCALPNMNSGGTIMFDLKKIAALLLSCTLQLSAFCSCSASREGVKLSDSSGAKKYAEENFGEAELVSTAKSSDAEIVYTFKDKEYGFEYNVRSFASGNSFDGENFGYSEKKSSDFSEQFQKYIDSQICDELEDHEKQYHFEFEWYGGTSADVAGTLIFEEEYISNAEQAARAAAESILSVDDRGYFKTVEIKSSRGLYGNFDLKEMTYDRF